MLVLVVVLRFVAVGDALLDEIAAVNKLVDVNVVLDDPTMFFIKVIVIHRSEFFACDYATSLGNRTYQITSSII